MIATGRHRGAQGAILLASLLICLPLPSANAQKHLPFNYVAAYKQAQEARTQADTKLIKIMEDIADFLAQFRRRSGHFPYVGVEENRALELIQKRIARPNPYTTTVIASAEEKQSLCPLQLIRSGVLSRDTRKDWLKKAPEDWKAPPGTITIIMNEKNDLVIWGAAADRQPVINNKNARHYLAWRSFLD